MKLRTTLLNEFHDFFLASQHPAASLDLTKSAAQKLMAGLLWQLGIQNFLEVLRLHLPESFDFMLSFIHLAFSMIGSLYETIPTFADT